MLRYLVNAAIKGTERLHRWLWKVSDWVVRKTILTLERSMKEDYPKTKKALANNVLYPLTLKHIDVRYWWSEKLDVIEERMIKVHSNLVRLRKWVENPQGLARALEPWVEDHMDLLAEYQKERLKKERNEAWQIVRAFIWIFKRQLSALGDAVEAALELRRKFAPSPEGGHIE